LADLRSRLLGWWGFWPLSSSPPLQDFDSFLPIAR